MSSTSTNNIGESQPPPPPPLDDGSNCNNIAGGNNVVRSEFGGVEYYDTLTMSEFGVEFVFGGPAAGKGT